MSRSAPKPGPSRRAAPAYRARPGGGRTLLFNKPYGVVCQFSPHPERPCLAQFVAVPAVYPAGRLDWDSEGLVILTDDGALQHRISHPSRKLPKVYYAQVEGRPDAAALDRLRAGIALADGVTAAARADAVGEPDWLWPRVPPIRARLHIPTSWIRLELAEGRNRQVRRMTAAVGHPTLRLVRWSVGPWDLQDLAPGCFRDAVPASVDPG